MFKGKLLEAIAELDVAAVRDCLEKEPDLISARDRAGRDLLQSLCSVYTREDGAKAKRQIAIADLLIALGLDVNAIGLAGRDRMPTFWFAVAKSRNRKFAEHLLSKGAKPNGFYAAGWYEDLDLVQLLIDAGAEIDPHEGGETPFLFLFKWRKYGALPLLLAAGANPNARDKQGRTALHTAIARPHPFEMFEMLLKSGAGPDIADRDGRTVREIASRKRDKAWIKAIEALATAPA